MCTPSNLALLIHSTAAQLMARMQVRMQGMLSPEVSNLLRIQAETVVFALRSQAADLTLVDCLIIVGCLECGLVTIPVPSLL